MESFIVTQISIDEIKKIIRGELEEFFSHNLNSKQLPEEDETGGIELAEKITGLKKQTIYGLVSERKIPHSKRGKRLYFSRKDVLDWIKKGKRKTGIEMAEMMDKLDPKR